LRLALLLQDHTSCLVILVNSVTKSIIKFYQCITITDETKVVASAPAIDCNSASYHQVEPLFFVVLLVLVIGAPLIMLAGLLWLKRKNTLNNERIQAQFGILYD
jgi:hypothetical protein